MAFIPVPNTVHVRLEGVLDRQQTINDLYFFQDGGITLPELQNLLANVFDWWNLSIVTLLSNDFRSVAGHARDLSTLTGNVADLSTGASTGGFSGESMSGNVAPCISFRTGLSGRAFRGRNYIPAIPTARVLLNTIDDEWAENVVSAYSLLLPDGSALPAGFTWVVVSRFSGVDVDGNPVPRLEGIPTTVVNALFTDLTVDSQRRRLPGRGR